MEGTGHLRREAGRLGAFMVREWRRGERVILAKNPNFWQADQVRLDGIEWVSMPDDNSRMLAVQSGELDAALAVPFSRVEELQRDPNLTVHIDPSTLENHLLINNEHESLAEEEVRQALDMTIDKRATRRYGDVRARRGRGLLRPEGALFHAGNPLPPTTRRRRRRCSPRPVRPG